MAEGIDRLGTLPATCQGVDAAGLIADATALREELLGLGPERLSERDVRHAIRVRLAR